MRLHDVMWPLLGVMIAGQLVWLLAAESAKKWLEENDPTYEREGVLARLFIGRLFTSFGPMIRYSRMRAERGEPTTLALVFWSGFAVSMTALLAFLLFITR